RAAKIELLGNGPADLRKRSRCHHLVVRARDPMNRDLPVDMGRPFASRRAAESFFGGQEQHVSVELFRHEVASETPIVPEYIEQVGKARLVESRIRLALVPEYLQGIADRIIPQGREIISKRRYQAEVEFVVIALKTRRVRGAVARIAV